MSGENLKGGKGLTPRRSYDGAASRRVGVRAEHWQAQQNRAAKRKKTDNEKASQETYPQRILVTFNGPRIKSIAAELRQMRAGHPEAASKDQLLALLPEGSRDLYRRAIDVMQRIAVEGRTIYDLREAIVRGKTLPDGTLREMNPECKYHSSVVPRTNPRRI